jgi:hypothetical protein
LIDFFGLRILKLSMAAISIACAADSPYLFGKLPPFFLGCFVNDLPAFIVLTSGVLKGGVDVLGEIAGSGIELAGATANTGTGHLDSESGVAAFTEPAEIIGIAVGLRAVAMIDNEKPRRAA